MDASKQEVTAGERSDPLHAEQSPPVGFEFPATGTCPAVCLNALINTYLQKTEIKEKIAKRGIIGRTFPVENWKSCNTGGLYETLETSCPSLNKPVAFQEDLSPFPTLISLKDKHGCVYKPNQPPIPALAVRSML